MTAMKKTSIFYFVTLQTYFGSSFLSKNRSKQSVKWNNDLIRSFLHQILENISLFYSLDLNFSLYKDKKKYFGTPLKYYFFYIWNVGYQNRVKRVHGVNFWRNFVEKKMKTWLWLKKKLNCKAFFRPITLKTANVGNNI